MENIKHSLKYEIIRLLCLIAFMGCAFVLVIESLTPGKKSARKSDAVGNVIGGFINDLNGDQAKEIDATSCLIKTVSDKRVFSVGEFATLLVETTPSDSTHKSYIYSSSDESIATVSKNGIVSFHKSGTVTIRAINAAQEEIDSEITFTINEVLATSIKSTVLNATYIDGEIPYFELEKSKNYKISNIIEPNTVTNKKVEYTISDSSYLSITNNVIYAKEVSDELIKIEAKTSNGLTSELYVKIIAKDIVEDKVMLESISSYDISKYVDQTSGFTPSVRYNPSYTSNEFKGYILESLDEDICYVSNNKLYIKGVSGIATIKIISSYDSSIFTTINLTVNNRSDVTDFDINYSRTMYVDDIKSISIKNIKPNDSLVKLYDCKSDNTSVIEATKSGVLEAKSVGSANILVTIIDSNGNMLDKTITVTVSTKPTTTVDAFDIIYKKGVRPTLYMNEKTNLKDYFSISNFYNDGNTIYPEDKNYYFSFDENVCTLDNSNITLTEYGLISGYIYYKNSDNTYVYQEIDLYSISKFKVQSSTTSTSYNLSVGSYIDFEIIDDYQAQKYDFILNGTSVKIRTNNKFFRITASDSGVTTLTINPNYDDMLLGTKNIKSLGYTITFNISDIYTDSLNINFKDGDNIIDYKHDYILYIDKNYSFEALVNDNTTKYNILVEDNGLIERKFETFTPKETGDLTITFKEEYSNIKKTYNFKIRNYIRIDNTKIYNITGKYSYKDGKIEIINGDTANINLAFTSDSTYKVVNYYSSDESVIKVYDDGTIEPQKQGEAIIRLEVNDGYEFLEYSIKFIVHKKNIIDDMTSFMLYIRKGVGHFGAFLILGIFATISAALFIRKKLYFVGVAANFAFGFLFAGFTEYLQTLTPQRVGCMSDILIDYTGYISSAIVVTIIFTTIFAIKFFKNRGKINNDSIDKEEVNSND